MPKRKRSKELHPAPSSRTDAATPSASIVSAATIRVDTEQERAARLFTESIRAHEVADQATRDRAAEAAQHERRHGELLAAKESAAARLRHLRTEGRPRQQMADAENDYRASLAALTEFETGERPHWAPAAPAEPEPESSGDSETATDGEALDQPS